MGRARSWVGRGVGATGRVVGVRRPAVLLVCAGMLASLLVVSAVAPSPASAEVPWASVDLRTFSLEHSPATWVLAADGSSVSTTVNQDPAAYVVSPDEVIDVEAEVTVRATEDDDFIGYVFGYRHPSAAAGDPPRRSDYLAVTWKGAPQGGAPEGFAVSRVDGDFTGAPAGGQIRFWEDGPGVDLLASRTGNAEGWERNRSYVLGVRYQSDRVTVSVDGVEVVDLRGEFVPGRFGLLAQSQRGLTFSDLRYRPVEPSAGPSADAGADQSVPEGSTVTLHGSAAFPGAAGALARYDASEGGLPSQVCPAWRSVRQGAATESVGDGFLTLADPGNNNDLVYYEQSAGVDFDGRPVEVEARMRFESGTSNAVRSPAAIFVTRYGSTGTVLQIGEGEVSLLAGNSTKGATAAVDTSSAFHTYRLVVGLEGSVEVYYDGSLILQGDTFHHVAANGTAPQVGFGQASNQVGGVSRWHHVRTNVHVDADCGPGGSVGSYRWALVSADGPPVQLSDPSSASPSFVAFDDGAYTFRLTADAGGASASDEVTITVGNQVPAVGRVDAGPTATDGLAQVTVGLSDAGPFDTHAVRFDWGDGTPVEEVAAAVNGSGWGYAYAGHVYASSGERSVTVTVVDDDGGVSAPATTTLLIGAAGQGEPAPGAALWAASSTGPLALDIKGWGNRVDGLVHSNDDVVVAGHSQQLTGGVEYRSSYSQIGHSQVVVPAPKKVAASGFPYAFEVADYQPGGRAAQAAGSRYRAVSAFECFLGTWIPTRPITPGLYYVPCAVKLPGWALPGQITIVATGPITVTGAFENFAPYSDGLLFMSTSSRWDAIDLNGLGQRFGGSVFAPNGTISISGARNEIECGVMGQRVVLIGAENHVGGTNCGAVGSGGGSVAVAAPPLLVPNLIATLSADRAAVLPGATVTYQASVANGSPEAGGASLFVPVQLGADNRGASAVTVTGATYRLEVHDPATNAWSTLATTDPSAPVGQRIATLTARPNPTAGVSYPAGPDPIGGTQVAPGALASWAGTAQVALSADQVASLLDPGRVDAIRNTVELATGGTQVRRIARFSADPLGELRAAPRADIADVRLELNRPGAVPETVDSATTAGLATLGPGQAVSVTRTATAPSPEPRRPEETNEAYLARLAALDGTALLASMYATGQAGVGRLIAPQQLAGATVAVPVIQASLSAPAVVDAGTSIVWTVSLTNSGSTAARAVSPTLVVSRVGEVAVAGLPDVVAPGETVTGTASVVVPDGVTATYDAVLSVTWGHDGGPAGSYGPVDAKATSKARPGVALAASKFLGTGVGVVVPPFQLPYVINVRNDGNDLLTGVVVDDPIDPDVVVVPGSVTTTAGVVLSGAAAGDGNVTVDVGTIEPGASATVTFSVDYRGAPPTKAQTSNQATITTTELGPVLSDDPAEPGVADPTVTPISPPGGDSNQPDPARPGPTLDGCTPSETDLVTAPTAIACTLVPQVDTTVASWRLSIQPVGAPDDEQRLLATGTGATVAGEIDPTVLANGQWTIRVTAIGSDGGASRLETTVVVDGGLKLGRNRITYTDLSVPVAGIPVRVQRTYDTLDRLHVGDFGYGWSVGVADFRVQANRTLGAGGWEQYQCGVAVMVAVFCVRPTAVHAVTVTWPEGRTETFDLAPQKSPPSFSFLTPVAYVGRPGTTSKLMAGPGDQYAMWTGDGNLYRPLEAELYQPTRFTLVARDGTRYLLDTASGLVEARDRNANTVTVSAEGIVSSSGVRVVFERDADGRIETVTGPDGRTLTYTYTAGELATVTDQNDHATTYTYEPGHFLDQVDDPGPGVASRLEYDPDGRLVAITDGTGHRTTVAVDPAARTQVVTAPGGGSTTLSTFDERGNVVSEDVIFADPGGDHHVTTWTYSTDGRDAITSRTDPNGHLWAADYDVAGNLVRFVDADGRVLSVDYDEFGAPTKTTDAAGLVTTYAYDARGNLTDIHELGVGGGDRHTHLAYDGAGRVTRRDGNAVRPFDYTYTSQGWVETATDALGHVTRSGYDPAGRLVSVTDANGKVARYAYDQVGNLTSHTSPAGRVRVYTYDGADRLLTSQDGDGFVTTNGYDDAGRLVAVTDALGQVTRYGYDAAGRLSTVTDPNGQVTTTGFDGGGRAVTVTDPRGKVTTTSYDRAGRVVAVAAPDRGTVVTGYTPGGLVASVTDGAGTRTDYAYDAVGRLLGETLAGVRTTTYGYDGWGRQTMVTDASGLSTRTVYLDSGEISTVTAGIAVGVPGGTGTVSFGYDAAGRRTSVRDGSRKDDNTARETVSELDPAGRVTSTLDAAGYRTSYVYDDDSNLIKTTTPSGVVTSFGYDNRGHQTQVVDALGNTMTSHWDAAGRRDWTQDARGARTTFGYDPAGQLVTITDAKGAVVRYGYDPAGRRTSVTDPNGNIRTFGFNDAGDPTSITLPATPTEPGGATSSATFDLAGRLVSATDARGLTTTSAYGPTGDLDHRVRQEPDGTSTTISYGYDPAGRRTSMTDPTGTTSWSYDTAGRTKTVASPAGTIGYDYDAAGRRTLMTLPAVAGAPGGQVIYGYDSAGRVRTVTNGTSAGGPTITSYGYLLDGRVNEISRPNGVTTIHGYDGAGRLVGLTHASVSGEKARYLYSLDGNGNRVAQRYRVDAGVETVETYTLDELSRLTDVTYRDTGQADHFDYDPAGNRTRVVSTGGSTPGTIDYHYDAAQQLTSSDGPAGTVTYGYDANGNLVSSSAGDTFGYDGANQLTSATVAGQGHTYRFDGDGTRVTADGHIQLYDTLESYPTLVNDGAGTATVHEPGSTGVLASSTATTTAYALSDALGSVRATTDATGAVTATADYGVYGTVRSATGSVGSFGFTGEQTDPTGLINLRARNYQPGTGRFLQADSIQPNAAGTQGWNLYSYTGGNPTSATDPSGHWAISGYVSAAERAERNVRVLAGSLYLAPTVSGGVPVVQAVGVAVFAYLALHSAAECLAGAGPCGQLLRQGGGTRTNTSTGVGTGTGVGTDPDSKEPNDPPPPPTTPDNVRCQVTAAVAPNTTGCEMVPVWFGQRRISSEFGAGGSIGSSPSGVIRVFTDARAPVVYIAESNRTLASYSLAGAPTAPACMMLSVPVEVRRRLNEDPWPPQISLPSPVVPVTKSMRDSTPVDPFEVTSTVSVPRSLPPC